MSFFEKQVELLYNIKDLDKAGDNIQILPLYCLAIFLTYIVADVLVIKRYNNILS